MTSHSKKIYLMFILMLFFSKITFSQIDKIVYSQATKDFMNANMQNSRSKFDGVTSKLTINFEKVKLLPTSKASIISKIKAIENVYNCEVLAESFEIVITRKAEEGCIHYAEFKEIIAQENIRILSNNELLFH